MDRSLACRAFLCLKVSIGELVAAHALAPASAMDGSARIAPHGITAATNIGSRSRIAMTAISPTASATVSSLRIIFVVSVFGRARAPAALAQGPGARLYVSLAALPVLLFPANCLLARAAHAISVARRGLRRANPRRPTGRSALPRQG